MLEKKAEVKEDDGNKYDDSDGDPDCDDRSYLTEIRTGTLATQFSWYCTLCSLAVNDSF